jgi:competence protein ComEA
MDIMEERTMKFITLISFVLSLLLTLPAMTFANEPAQPENMPVKMVSDLININTADLKTLQSLPGLGKTKAAAIIAYREQFGEFASLADLKNVKGIGDKVIAKLDGKISF